MLKFTSIKDGSVIEFKTAVDAAQYFTHKKIAASYKSAILNIRSTIAGWQSTGAVPDGFEHRKSAYGYTLSVDKFI